MEEENKKIGFFSRIKIAVTKLENYSIFLGEKMSVAVKYFLLIVLVLSAVIAFLQTYDMMEMINKGYQYIKDELPDFSYEDEVLEFSENVYSYDQEYDMYMIADTAEEISEEQLQEYKNEIKSTGFIFLKDRAIYVSGGSDIEYSYSDLSSQYGVSSLTRDGLIEQIEEVGMMGIAITLFCVFLLSIYLVQVISVFMDWIIIAIFALIAARICKVGMTFKQCFSISIYALTLSLILSMVYEIAYYLVGFYTAYFRIVYLLISYVYVVAAILMMKSDLLKQHAEVTKIEETQQQIHDEYSSPEENNEDNKEEPKDDDSEQDTESNDSEPDGSESC